MVLIQCLNNSANQEKQVFDCIVGEMSHKMEAIEYNTNTHLRLQSIYSQRTVYSYVKNGSTRKALH